MAKLVLHIGTHKTGTTSLQDQLFQSRESLAAQGIIYPDLSPHSGHHGYLTDWIHLPKAYELPGGGLNNLRNLANKYRGSDQTVFLSSEEFSRAGGQGGSVDFADLRAIFEGYDVQVICVLRDQLSFLQSVYLELSRNSLPKRPPEFLADALETGQVDGLWCDYSGLYVGLRSQFAADEIGFVDYAKAMASSGGVLKSVLSLISTEAETLLSSGEKWSNQSPKILPVWAAQVVAGWNIPSPLLVRCAREAFDLEFGTDAEQALFLSTEARNARDRFAAWNSHFQTILARDGKTFELQVPALSDRFLSRADITSGYWIRFARRLHFAATEQTTFAG